MVLPDIGSNLPSPTSSSSTEMFLRNCSPIVTFPPNISFSVNPFLTQGRNVLAAPFDIYPMSAYFSFLSII